MLNTICYITMDLRKDYTTGINSNHYFKSVTVLLVQSSRSSVVKTPNYHLVGFLA